MAAVIQPLRAFRDSTYKIDKTKLGKMDNEIYAEENRENERIFNNMAQTEKKQLEKVIKKKTCDKQNNLGKSLQNNDAAKNWDVENNLDITTKMEKLKLDSLKNDDENNNLESVVKDLKDLDISNLKEKKVKKDKRENKENKDAKVDDSNKKKGKRKEKKEELSPEDEEKLKRRRERKEVKEKERKEKEAAEAAKAERDERIRLNDEHMVSRGPKKKEEAPSTSSSHFSGGKIIKTRPTLSNAHAIHYCSNAELEELGQGENIGTLAITWDSFLDELSRNPNQQRPFVQAVMDAPQGALFNDEVKLLCHAVLNPSEEVLPDEYIQFCASSTDTPQEDSINNGGVPQAIMYTPQEDSINNGGVPQALMYTPQEDFNHFEPILQTSMDSLPCDIDTETIHQAIMNIRQQGVINNGVYQGAPQTMMSTPPQSISPDVFNNSSYRTVLNYESSPSNSSSQSFRYSETDSGLGYSPDPIYFPFSPPNGMYHNMLSPINNFVSNTAPALSEDFGGEPTFIIPATVPLGPQTPTIPVKERLKQKLDKEVKGNTGTNLLFKNKEVKAVDEDGNTRLMNLFQDSTLPKSFLELCYCIGERQLKLDLETKSQKKKLLPRLNKRGQHLLDVIRASQIVPEKELLLEYFTDLCLKRLNTKPVKKN